MYVASLEGKERERKAEEWRRLYGAEDSILTFDPERGWPQPEEVAKVLGGEPEDYPDEIAELRALGLRAREILRERARQAWAAAAAD